MTFEDYHRLELTHSGEIKMEDKGRQKDKGNGKSDEKENDNDNGINWCWRKIIIIIHFYAFIQLPM